MRPETFVKLALTALASSVLALTAYGLNNRWDAGTVTGERLLPGLDGLGSRIATVSLTQGGKTLTFESRPGADAKSAPLWSIKERDGHPAEAEKIRALILRLAKAQKIEPKTRNAERHGLLEVEDPKVAGAKSRLVRILDKAGTPLAEVVIGKKRWDAFGSGQSGTYVRRPADPQVWLVNADLEPQIEARAWLKTDVLRLAAEDIVSIRVEVPGEAPLVIERADGKVRFAALPEAGQKLKDETTADSLLRAAASIDADDVRKLAAPVAPATAAAPGKDAAATAAASGIVTVTTKGGVDVRLNVRRDGEHAWIAIDATGSGEAAKPAADIAARTIGWEHRVPAVKADQLLKKRSDLQQATGG